MNFEDGVKEVRAVLQDLILNNDTFMEANISVTKERIGWMPTDSPELDDEELEAHPKYELYYAMLEQVSNEMIDAAIAAERSK